MASSDPTAALTPLQRVIYSVDQLGLNLRESMRLTTQRVGFFVGQERYLRERERMREIVAQLGPPEVDESDQTNEATHQIGSP